MKRFLIPFVSLILILIILAFVTWFNIPNILAHILSREFSVSTTVGNVNISKNNLKINDINIGTPKGSKTSSSFFSKELHVKSTIAALRNERLTIDSFTLNNIIIGIEFYNESGTDNNWVRILKIPTRPEKLSNRKYLIKKMTLNNISLVLTKSNGQKQTFPTIDKLEFFNISDETGFPIEEIEKAISEAILKSVFEKFNLLYLIRDLNPVNMIQKVLPFFNKE